MKKLIALFMLVAMAVAAQAQSLTGKNWYTDLSDDDADGGIIMLFDPEGAFAMTLLMVEGDDDMTLTFTYMVPGLYTLDGNEIKVSTLTELAEVDAKIVTDGMTDEQKALVKLMQPVIDEQKEQVKAGLNETFSWTDEPLTINELTDNRLVLTDGDGKKMIFTPVEE